MMRWQVLVGTLCAALLSACAAPDYQVGASNATAQVRLINFNRPGICVAGERFTLTPDATGYVSLPAGRPVHLTGSYERMGGRCDTAIKFTPQAGQVYDVLNEPRAERCVVTVMQQDTKAQYGFRLERSAMPAPTICR